MKLFAAAVLAVLAFPTQQASATPAICYIATDTWLQSTLLAEPGLHAELAGRNYLLNTDAGVHHNLHVALDVPSITCDPATGKCDITCQSKLLLDSSPVNPVDPSERTFRATKRVTHEFEIARDQQSRWLFKTRSDAEKLRELQKMSACTAAAIATLRQLPECDPAQFYPEQY